MKLEENPPVPTTKSLSVSPVTCPRPEVVLSSQIALSLTSAESTDVRVGYSWVWVDTYQLSNPSTEILQYIRTCSSRPDHMTKQSSDGRGKRGLELCELVVAQNCVARNSLPVK